MPAVRNIARVQPLVEPVTAQINISGSKSFTNRALIIAFLANGTSTLQGCSNSNDSLLLIKILRQLGGDIIRNGTAIIVKGNGGKFKEFSGKINVEDAGTVMRFLTALCCFIPGEIILESSERMHKRPIKGLVDGLLQLGADITYLGESGFPPIKIKGGMLHGGKVNMDASSSSQFISALLMITPLLNSDIEINAIGEIASAPYIDMTLSVMKYFGVSVQQEPRKYFIKAGSAYTSTNYTVEADASSASYFFALAAITQSTIRVNSLSPLSLQGDVKFIDLLEQMGCKISKRENYMEVTGTNELHGIKTDMKDMQDVAQTLAVVAAFANGDTTITGVKNLEIKETKRLTALQKELLRMGIKSTIGADYIIIKGGLPNGALIRTSNDHRMAMAFAIAGAKIPYMQIESPEVVSKSFPEFWQKLGETGIKTQHTEEPMNIVLIGYMGAGKTTVAKLLSELTGLPLVETDSETIALSGLESVSEIFEQKGEAYFRQLENKAVTAASLKTGLIISCGGGIVMKYDNIAALRKFGKIIYLAASFNTITQRLNNSDSRPLFIDEAMAHLLYQIRLPLYTQYADEVIQTDKLSPSEIVNIIASKINLRSA
jgi:3-phosphoshikimate 1-carboxyvinyltransferase